MCEKPGKMYISDFRDRMRGGGGGGGVSIQGYDYEYVELYISHTNKNNTVVERN